MKSRYIAIEGGDGSGKSTVAAALEERLNERGDRTLMVREPGSTKLGEQIRDVLLHGGEMSPWTEAFLFAAQRAQLAEEVIGPALDEGTWVISDRTYFSSIAYQGAGRDLGTDTVRRLNEVGLAGVEPGHVFVLDVDVDVALSRQGNPDRIGGEGEAFHRKVRDAYRELAEQEPDRVVIIDNALGPDEAVDRIMRHL